MEAKSSQHLIRQEKTRVNVVLTIVFLAYFAQMTLSPIIAPLSREVHLEEWQVGATISMAAIMVVITSQFWGRRSQAWGSRRVLLLSISTLLATAVCFTVVCALAMNGVFSSNATFISFLLTRGMLFGAALAAVAPTAQTVIASLTSTESQRVRGMAGIGAAQGMAMIAGAVTGGVLAKYGLLVSIAAVPVIVLVALTFTVLRLQQETADVLIAEPPRISPFDRRVFPFLIAGFGMFTGLGFIQIITGFLIQDRYHLDSATTGMMAGLTLLVSGLVLIVTQSVIVPKSKWSPTTLLRVGTGIGTIGFLMIYPAGSMFFLALGVSVVTLGIAIAIPGYTAGPTLLMSKEEQGGLAGLLGAANGLTYVVSPTLSTSLYGISNTLPILIGGAALFIAFLIVMLHPRFSHMPKGCGCDND